MRAALEARAQYPGLGVLILSQYVEPVYTAELLDSGEGGIGYLLKERVGDVKAFVAAVENVARGGTALDREVVSELVRRRDPDGGDGALAALTPREREVLGLMAEGQTNTAIARALVVTPGRRREAHLEHLQQAGPARHRRGSPAGSRRSGVPARGVGQSSGPDARAAAWSRGRRGGDHRSMLPAPSPHAPATWPI